MQIMYTVIGGRTKSLRLPAPDTQVLPGLPWGTFDTLLTPAYWRGQAWQSQLLGWYRDFRLGHTLIEEVVACLLGGYGMPAELGIAAYLRLRDRGLIVIDPDVDAIRAALVEPLAIAGRQRRYRFPRQKGEYIAACLERLAKFEEPERDVDLRDALAALPGVGLKTASWITRNYRASDSVAIIDVHILRAGRAVHLFPPNLTPHRHYRQLEARFLSFAQALGTPTGLLDGIIWDQMRRLPNTVGRGAMVYA